MAVTALPKSIALKPCSFMPPSFHDRCKVALTIGVIASMIGSGGYLYYRSENTLPPLLFMGAELAIGYALNRITEIALFDSFAKICLRPLLHEKIEHAVTPPLGKDYYNHHQQKAFEVLSKSAETLPIHTIDNTLLDAIWMPNSDGDRVVVLYPGNTVSAAVMMISWGRWYYQNGFTVCAFTTRGQKGEDGSGSNGIRPCMAQELTLLQDGTFILDYLHDQKGVPYEKMNIHAYSTGAAVATYATILRPIDKLVVDRGFTSFSNAASKKIKGVLSADILDTFYAAPPETVDEYVPTRLNTLHMMSHSQASSILCMEASEDHLIYKGSAKNLARAASRTARWTVFEGTHAIETAFLKINNFPAPDGFSAAMPILLQKELENTFRDFWQL